MYKCVDYLYENSAVSLLRLLPNFVLLLDQVCWCDTIKAAWRPGRTPIGHTEPAPTLLVRARLQKKLTVKAVTILQIKTR